MREGYLTAPWLSAMIELIDPPVVAQGVVRLEPADELPADSHS